ncbi:hypothetical protein OSCI_3280039 [Kamptonema sp. PCC 6506]|nr:hypothetical protein OSCI_3280039 [Kamptonema sp. PCC 6506]
MGYPNQEAGGRRQEAEGGCRLFEVHSTMQIVSIIWIIGINNQRDD